MVICKIYQKVSGRAGNLVSNFEKKGKKTPISYFAGGGMVGLKLFSSEFLSLYVATNKTAACILYQMMSFNP